MSLLGLSTMIYLSLDKTMSIKTLELCVLNTFIFISKRRMTGVSGGNGWKGGN